MEESIKKTSLKLIISYLSVILAIYLLIGEYGVFGEVFKENTFWKFLIYGIVMTHITITSMSLSFHRYHTHKGVILNPILDTLMQLNLWLVGGMSKLDWVSVHIYHHAFSDKPEDPHSPVQKGILHILFLGVFDYSKAKESEPVLRIRKTIRRNKLEQFIADHTLLGIVFNTLLNLVFSDLYMAQSFL
jgi:stearoyl-CoA desaturase (delta-9 desaturase)